MVSTCHGSIARNDLLPLTNCDLCILDGIFALHVILYNSFFFFY